MKGLDLFRRHFKNFNHQYVLIGGAACDLIMDEAGLNFRSTKDLDIVLCVEALDRSFVDAFWAFIRAGEYQVQEKSSGVKQFYRFKNPSKTEFPVMLELFARAPDVLRAAEGSHLAPVPVEEEPASLSAILLDEDYYAWIQRGKQIVVGVSVVGPEHIIPLKARAWLDLSAKKAAGSEIGSKEVKKHKNDVFRLLQVVSPAPISDVPESIKGDMLKFVEAMKGEEVHPSEFGLGKRTKDEVLLILTTIYAL